MPIVKVIARDATVEINSDILSTGEITVDVPSKWVNYVVEYLSRVESDVPAGPVTAASTLVNTFTDDDSAFFARLLAEDPFLVDFTKVVVALDMPKLRQKMVMAIAVAIVGRAGGVATDRIADEFNRFALKNKA